jgi:hypothetical protein
LKSKSVESKKVGNPLFEKRPKNFGIGNKIKKKRENQIEINMEYTNDDKKILFL